MTDCAEMLKALSDSTRLKVVRLLVDRPCHVSEINERIGKIDQSLLSHHLKVLRDSGIVEAERDGKAVLYRLTSSIRARTRARGIDFGCCKLLF